MRTDKPTSKYSQPPKQPLTIHTSPLLHSGYYPSIIFELMVTLYFFSLVIFNISQNMSNLRIVLYAILFFANQCISNLIAIESSVDQLGLYPMKNMLFYLQGLVRVNMFYLLLRLMLNSYSISPPLLFIFFIYKDIYIPYKKYKNQSNDKNSQATRLEPTGSGLSLAKVIEFSNPILVYCISKTMHGELNDLSILFLIFFSLNLILSSELRQLLLLDRCNIYGWKQIVVQELPSNNNQGPLKIKNTWDKKQALKGIVMASAVALALQNFLLIFESVKQQICLVIVHTLFIGIMSQILEFKLFGNSQSLASFRKKKLPLVRYSSSVNMSMFSI